MRARPSFTPARCMQILRGRQTSRHDDTPPIPLGRSRQFAWAYAAVAGSGGRTFDTCFRLICS
jgi:hypothetical protein